MLGKQIDPLPFPRIKYQEFLSVWYGSAIFPTRDRRGRLVYRSRKRPDATKLRNYLINIGHERNVRFLRTYCKRNLRTDFLACVCKLRT